MSAISFKNFLSFVELDEPETLTDQELYELFGFGADKKKVAALRASSAQLKAKADALKADRSTQKLDKGGEQAWRGGIENKISQKDSDPRKVYKDQASWRTAIGKLAGKDAKFEKNQVTDENGYIIAKWNPDKVEGWIELRPVKESKGPVGTVTDTDLFSGKKNPSVDASVENKFHVIDNKTGEVVGKYKTATRARTVRNKKDLAYGAIRYKVKEIK